MATLIRPIIITIYHKYGESQIYSNFGIKSVKYIQLIFNIQKDFKLNAICAHLDLLPLGDEREEIETRNAPNHNENYTQSSYEEGRSY